MNNSQTNTTIEENIGGIPYILKYLEIYVPYSFFAFIGVVIGIIGELKQ